MGLGPGTSNRKDVSVSVCDMMISLQKQEFRIQANPRPRGMELMSSFLS